MLAGLLHIEVPPQLAGFSDEDQTKLRALFFETVQPEIWKVREEYEDVVEHVEVSIRVAEGAVYTYGDPAKLADINSRDERMKAAQDKLAASA